MKTYSAKPLEIKKKWLIIDAKNLILGRLASHVSMILRGKHKPFFTPHLDCGDNVVVINAKYIALTGKKKTSVKDGKIYYRHTGFPGGIKSITAGKILSSDYSERVLQLAVKRMITRNVLGAKQLGNLYIYPDSTHPHTAQKPEFYNFAEKNKKNIKY